MQTEIPGRFISCHPHKTKSMLVTGKRLQNFVAPSLIDVNLDGSNIEHLTGFKLVCETLDRDLSFNRHASWGVMQKIVETYWNPSSDTPYLKRDQHEIHYCTIIKPVLLYGSTIWTSCSKENTLKLLPLQTRAAWIAHDADGTASSVSLFNTLKWIPFRVEPYVNRCTF